MQNVLSLLLPFIAFAQTITPAYTPLPVPIPRQEVVNFLFAPLTPPTPSVVPTVRATEDTTTKDKVSCSCVLTLREEIPDLPLLNAIDFPLNTIDPKVGDIIKIQYYNATTSKYVYHIQLIREITEKTYEVYQGNKPACTTSTESVLKTDERILGFFSMDRQRLIDQLTPIQKQTLWNESGWSMYDTKRRVLRGKAGEIGVSQWMKNSWLWMEQKRRNEKNEKILLDIYSFEDQIENFKYGWDRGIVWYGRPPEI